MKFDESLSKYPFILGEGAVIERIRRGEFSYDLDKYIVHSGMIYDDTGKQILEKIFNQYISVGHKFDLPIILLTPTWRANPERLKLAGFKDTNVNADCFRFLSDIREKYGNYSKKIFIGGLIGCKGDAYKPEEALSSEEAYIFHAPQVEALAEAGVDFLTATGLPSASEALGIARVMEKSHLSYVLSFIIRPNGKLLDGTFIDQAFSSIDTSVSKKPLYFGVNCVHPVILRQAIDNEVNKTELVQSRLKSIFANGSSKSPEELVLLNELDSDDPVLWAKKMISLYTDMKIKIQGGCCGTSNLHIEKIAEVYQALRN
ncbi:MAG: homocysteine S-methyltransferase family protein [Candidatus Heimdallarchaeaceae archaeon]|jgi:S-methylmethionine-dependent homocysteine/selenocysteine methylase